MEHESLTNTSKRGVQLKGHLFFKGCIGHFEDLSRNFDHISTNSKFISEFCRISTNLKIYQQILSVYHLLQFLSTNTISCQATPQVPSVHPS